MKLKIIAVALLGISACAIAVAQQSLAPPTQTAMTVTERPHTPLRPVHTFSIVARDPQTGEIGAAVQSHWFAVGQSVIWAEAGVGAVATQSFVDPSYGPLGLALMKTGKSAPDALAALLAGDPGRDVRQVAMIDAQGRAMSFTGKKDIAAAGSQVGMGPEGWSENRRIDIDEKTIRSSGAYIEANESLKLIGGGYAVQANLMANDKVWPAMAKAFREAKGDLADRMLVALDAAQAVGGDIRGRQSAALIVVKAKSSGKPWEDRTFDVRVDDAAEPLKELRRLVALQRAYNHMNAGDAAVERKDNEAALREYAAAEQLAQNTPGVLPSRLAEMIYWHAVSLVNMNRVADSLPLFKRAFSIEPSWRELTPRLLIAGLLPGDETVIKQIVAQ